MVNGGDDGCCVGRDLPVTGDDELGVVHRRLDEAIVHRLHRGSKLGADRLGRPAALRDVTPDSTSEPEVLRAVAKHAQGESVRHRGEREEQDAFDEDDGSWLDSHHPLTAGVGSEVVDRGVDCLPDCERVEMGEEQLGVERVGVVVVDHGPVGRGEVPMIAVVGVEGQYRGSVGTEESRHLEGERALPRPTSSADSDQLVHWVGRVAEVGLARDDRAN